MPSSGDGVRSARCSILSDSSRLSAPSRAPHKLHATACAGLCGGTQEFAHSLCARGSATARHAQAHSLTVAACSALSAPSSQPASLPHPVAHPPPDPHGLSLPHATAHALASSSTTLLWWHAPCTSSQRESPLINAAFILPYSYLPITHTRVTRYPASECEHAPRQPAALRAWFGNRKCRHQAELRVGLRASRIAGSRNIRLSSCGKL